MICGKIKRLERVIDGHSYTSFEVGEEISEILDITESENSQIPYIYREFEIHYKNGVIKELVGGIFTIERFPVDGVIDARRSDIRKETSMDQTPKGGLNILKPYTQVKIQQGAMVAQGMGFYNWENPDIILEVEKYMTPTRVKLIAPAYGHTNKGAAAYGNGAIYADVEDLKVMSQPVDYKENFIVINKKHLSMLPPALRDKLMDTLAEVALILPDNKYIVCNQDEPYARSVLRIILCGEASR